MFRHVMLAGMADDWTGTANPRGQSVWVLITDGWILRFARDSESGDWPEHLELEW